MSRRLVDITLDNLGDLPRDCRACVYWELDPVAGERAREACGTELEKEAWISDMLLEWGSCGKLVYADGVAAGYVLFAPPAYVPRSVSFPTSPVSPDAVLLMTARLRPDYLGYGLGRMLIQGVVRDVATRGVRAIEAFGRPATGGVLPSGGPGTDCRLPASYLLAVGFKTTRPHPRSPRLRLDVRTAVSWKEDVESAIDRLIASVSLGAIARG